MGRTLEALRQADTHRRGSGTAVPPVQKDPAARPQDDGSIPFIEVGGPRGSIDGSAEVLAEPPPQTKRIIRRPTVAESEKPPIHPILSGLAPIPEHVSFRPLPLDGSLRPGRDRFASDLVTFHQPDHALSKQYDDLLESLASQLPRSSPVILCTGGPGATERSTVLLNLALAYARKGMGQAVAIDGGAGLMASKLGLSPMPGLRDVLAGSATLQTAVRESGQANLQILTAGSADLDIDAQTSIEKTRQVLKHLRDHFDWLLIDGQAWDDSPALTALALAADAIYLVVREADVKSPETTSLLRRIPQSGGRLCGYIVTRP